MDTKEVSKKRCFIISPIGNEGSETRIRSDKILRHLITDPVVKFGYEIIRADKISEPGIITTQIIDHIVNCELVVADLTDKNPNVFYELAIRHAIRKPLVQIIKQGEIIPFDVAATRIIQFDLSDLDSVSAAKDQITSQVAAIESHNENYDIQNPISVSIDLKNLRESSSIEERSLADIVEAISDLRTTIISSEKSSNLLKLQEEIKIMLNEFLSLNLDRQILSKVRKGKDIREPVERVFYMHKHLSDPNISLLALAASFREESPVIYELLIDAYRELKTISDSKQRRMILHKLESNINVLSEQNVLDNKYIHMMSTDLSHFFEKIY